MLKIENKIYLSWSDVEDLVGVLCEKIATKIPNVTHISGLARGGLIPAVLVSHKLNLPYTDKILWSDDKVIRNTLLIDDICDSGETLYNSEAAITAVLHQDLPLQLMLKGLKVMNGLYILGKEKIQKPFKIINYNLAF